MPRKLEAGGSYPFVLKTDRDGKSQATFLLKILNARDDDKLRSLTELYRTSTASEERLDALRDAIAIVLVGWKNMNGIEFSIDAAMDLLTKRECFELIGDATLEAALTPDERKKLESQVSSVSAVSAPDAAKPAMTE